MKVLVVAENERTIAIIKKHLVPLGFDFVFYSNPVKAIDNIPEISPDMVLISAEDYPRHWKPVLIVLRQYKTLEECVFVILKTSFFSLEEAEKATYLGVNGLVDEDLEEHLFIEKLKGIFTRYLLPRESRRYRRYFISADEKIDFVFNHPETMEIVSANVVEISEKGLTIHVPENIVMVLPQGSKIEYCSVKLDDKIISTDCTVFRSGEYTTLLYDNLEDDTADFIKNFFETKYASELPVNG